MNHGLSTRYVRTGPMHPSNRVSVEEMSRRLYGEALPVAEILALCEERGIPTRIERGQVVGKGRRYEYTLETVRQVEQVAAERARA